MAYPTLDEMRHDLANFTKITADTPPAHVELFWRLYKGATDTQRPNWSRYEFELFFELLADGEGDNADKLEALQAMLNRGAEHADDFVGRWLDADELDASA